MGTPLSNSQGFTLIELLAAIVILMVGLLGLLQSVNIAMEHDLRNLYRDTAVRLAEQKMNEAKGLAYTNITSYSVPRTLAVPVRNASEDYSVLRTVTQSSPADISRQIDIRVSWAYRNVTTMHTVSSMRARNVGE